MFADSKKSSSTFIILALIGKGVLISRVDYLCDWYDMKVL